jgi:hypothetical protein
MTMHPDFSPARQSGSRASRAGVRERGAALILSLLFLVIIAILAISTFNSSTTNLRVTGNMVSRDEKMASNQAVLDRIISHSNFISDPNAVANSTYIVPIDGTNTIQVTVTPAPACYQARAINMNELDPAKAQDLACMGSSVVRDPSQQSPASFCSATNWNIRATYVDPGSGTQIGSINRGIGVRVPSTDALNDCK